MKKNFIFIFAAVLTVFFVAGCSTVPKKVKEDMAGMKTKVDTLESRVENVENKQAAVERMTAEQAQALEEMKSAKSEKMEKSNISIKTRETPKAKARTKDIQVCLKNAGFYQGKISGVKGKSTKKAIKEFQRANGLKADGVVGPKTWELLSKYQSGAGQAAPAPAAGSEEGATK